MMEVQTAATVMSIIVKMALSSSIGSAIVAKGYLKVNNPPCECRLVFQAVTRFLAWC